MLFIPNIKRVNVSKGGFIEMDGKLVRIFHWFNRWRHPNWVMANKMLKKPFGRGAA